MQSKNFVKCISRIDRICGLSICQGLDVKRLNNKIFFQKTIDNLTKLWYNIGVIKKKGK